MIYRTRDAHDIYEVVERLLPDTIGFDLEKWLHDDDHIVLTDGNGNYNLLEMDRPGIYAAHTFYTVRGKEAVKLGREAVKHFFDNYDVTVLGGQTPVKLAGARWFNRQIGMKSYGIIETVNGPHELFLMHRKDYEDTK